VATCDPTTAACSGSISAVIDNELTLLRTAAHNESFFFWLQALRRKLHQKPELGFEEYETSALIRATLESLDVPYKYPIAKTGIMAWIGDGNQPCVALRADMDALPIQEDCHPDDQPFKSSIDGVSHMCGHDAHVAMLLGAVKLLKEREKTLAGTVKFIFQPAEEGKGGAALMVKEGVLAPGPEGLPPVEAIFGLHVWPSAPSGQVFSRAGAIMAASGRFEAVIEGKSGHGAMPHLSVDPIPAAAAAISALQTIVSREVDPLEAAVVSVTMLKAGNAFNVIPEAVEIGGTIRSFSLEGHRRLTERVKEIINSTAAVYRCTSTFNFHSGMYPPTINDEGSWRFAKASASALFGESNVSERPPSMGAEDFSFYLQQVPGAFLMIGIANETLGTTWNLHSNHFRMDESVMPLGSLLHSKLAIDYLALHA